MPSPTPDLPAPLRFLDGGGAATRLILARDWSDHPLGSPEDWSEGLKTSLSTILNSPESMILAWGEHELTFFFNETYFPLLGPRLDWAMGARFDRVWADGWEQAKPIIDDAFAGRAQRFVDLPWKLDTDRGAADTWFTFSYSRILDAQGDIAGLFILTNETSGKVLAEQRQRETEEQLLRAQEAGGIGMFVVRPDGTIEPTASFCRLYGVAPVERISSRVFEDLVHPDDRHLASRHDSRLTGTAPMDVEYRIHRADTGVLRWIARKGELERDSDGDFLRFVGVAHDITERVEARRALIAEREQLAQMFEQAPTFMAMLEGPEHRFVRVNPGYMALVGGRDVLGRTVAEALPETIDQGFLAALDQVYRSGEAFLAENGRIDLQATPGGPVSTRYLDFVYQPLRAADGRVTGIFVEGADVTQRRRAEDDLRLLNAELEQRVEDRTAELMTVEESLRQAQKMEAVGQLTGGIAHDFNNLLTGITGSLEMMQVRIAQGRAADVDRYIDAAQGAARRAAALTHRLLAFSRRQTLAPKPTDVTHLVAGMAELIRRTVGPSCEIEAVNAAGLWPSLIDPGQLENAVLNLCINARDAMPEGGRIGIETANRTIDRRTAADRGMEPGDYISVCVSDTGTGMDAGVIARAFEPFFTTKPIGMGTGLGLSMIYGFARQSGGSVHIYSELGLGTNVGIYLPRFLGDAATGVASEDGAPEAPRGAGETVLVVDDEPTVRMLVVEVLSDLGYTAIEAGDGAAGLKILASDVRIDLLVTDVGLPGGMNGRQVADAARGLRPELKVLFITGYAENAVLSHDHLDPGMHVLTKPFAIDVLANRIRELIAGQRAATPVTLTLPSLRSSLPLPVGVEKDAEGGEG